MRRLRIPALVPVFIIALFAFTNCGEGFEGIQESISQTSAACFNKIRNEVLLKVPADECEKTEDYLCERRIFSPLAKNGKYLRRECGLTSSSGEVCVNVLENTFDTSGARTLANESDFSAGADYNRQEIQCAHSKLTVNGISAIQAEGETVFSALSSAIEKCRARGVR